MLIERPLFPGSYTRSAAHPENPPSAAATAPIPIWFETWRRMFPCLPSAKHVSEPYTLPSDSDTSSLPPPPPIQIVRQPELLGMPYTPPSHRSPASSASSSPKTSRRSSFHGASNASSSSGPGAPSRPALPRSASYLTKHRRTPSAVLGKTPSSDATTPDVTPPGTSDDLKGMVASHNTASVRQSPPPVADAMLMPPGAIISPPDSQASSEDEGMTADDSRGRQIETLKALHDAISTIPQHRESSPNRTSPGDLLVLPSQLEELIEAVPLGLNDEATVNASKSGPRKILHSRSNTEPNAYISKSVGASLAASDEDDSEQDDLPKKPQMVRKKSGELVRPALRPASHRRPSSMPGTPTYSKAVHFDSHLEHVRHFLQVDRPLAVSAGSSPADNYESDAEYPFNSDDKSGNRELPHEWEIIVNSFPSETPMRKGLPVRVERVWMSSDQKSLLGSIAVANLAFQKSVVCRFTFDYWKTTSEVAAEFHHEIRPRESDVGHDRFQFTIKLSDLANLESKTLFFCVRYNVNGQEYWDNNNDMNFQVDFRKKMLPQNGKKNFQGASSRPLNSLPKSTRRTSTSPGIRPKSMPPGSLDAFGHDSKLMNFDHPIHEYIGESGSAGLRLKISKSTTSLPSDNLANRLSAPSGLAFANRYDFGASLSAAKQAHKDSVGSPRSDALYMKPHKKASFGPPVQTSLPKTNGFSHAPNPSSAAPKIPGTESPASANIASASYDEIVNKYCFYGSKQNSPQIKDGTLQSGRYDGVSDGLFTRTTNSTTNSTNSSSNGSPYMANKAQHDALHYALHQNLNPYFQNTHLATGASPAESPLSGNIPMSQRSLSPGASGTPGAKSTSPNSMGGGLTPLAGTSPGYAIDAAPFHVHDRFPFAAEAHSSPAIRG